MKPYQSKIRYLSILSEVLDISGGTLTLDVEPSFVHNFAGIIFYSDAGGNTVVTPSAGTSTWSVKLVVQPNEWQDVIDNVLDVTIPDQIDWAGNTNTVRVILTGMTGAATHARIIFAGNSS